METIPPKWDIFISHASEDKDAVARPLAYALWTYGIKVWFDDNALRAGDSLTDEINKGIVRSTYAIVIISKNYITKNWTRQELAGFLAREDGTKKLVVPIWYNITREEVRNWYPIMADRLAIQWTGSGRDIDKLFDTFLFEDLQHKGIEGLWYGKTGKLRFSVVTGYAMPPSWYYASYDWNNEPWTGKICGGFWKDSIFVFEWRWHMPARENGVGYFRFNKSKQTLRGAWCFASDAPPVAANWSPLLDGLFAQRETLTAMDRFAPDLLKLRTNWTFTRKPEPMFSSDLLP